MKYQYATVNSELESNDKQEFVIDNDTLQIRYNFFGDGGPVMLTIVNKLNQPLFIDWSRSALVLNDKSNTFWENKSGLQATAEGQEIRWTPDFSSTSATINGEISGEKTFDFIAPKASKEINKFTLDKNFKDLKRSGKEHRSSIRTREGTTTGVIRYHYQKEDSPLNFRTYLTLSTQKDFANSLVYESEFWVSNIMQTSASPQQVLNEQVDRNKYYKSKATGFGAAAGFAGLFLILGLVSTNNN